MSISGSDNCSVFDQVKIQIAEVGISTGGQNSIS